MIFRTSKGELIEIKRYDYKSDTQYFKKIMEIKKENVTLKNITNEGS